MEQTGGRLLRNAGSWYEHQSVMMVITNEGEVLGASIGPGSNSQYISLTKLKKIQRLLLDLKLSTMIMTFIIWRLKILVTLEGIGKITIKFKISNEI